MSPTFPYIPGDHPPKAGPLSRFLPPVPDGVVEAYLQKNLPAGSWLLDPFGAEPRTAVEAARAGYRVIVAANNPVVRFLIEMAASPPSPADLRLALADLAASYKGSERIEPHIHSLYTTECAVCGQEISVHSFLWEQNASAPYARIYHCPNCGDSGERPTTDADIERAKVYSGSRLHRARALERVAPTNDPDRVYAEEALEFYLPRTIYALFTLINKIEKLSASPSAEPQRIQHLYALMLSTLDQTNALWHHPAVRSRPRQLTIPSRFREKNVWLALEEAVSEWSEWLPEARPVQITKWPEEPSGQGGIVLFEGRFKEIGDELSQLPFAGVVAALPRYNQAFWSLSALWAGWLWGSQSTASFKSILRRRRFDWSWHTAALCASLNHLAPMLKTGISFFGLIGEAEPNFLSAAILSSAMTGFDLEGLALREDEKQVQFHWRRSERSKKGPEKLDEEKLTQLFSRSEQRVLQKNAQKAATTYLSDRGEPSEYMYLHAAALKGLADAGLLKKYASVPPPEAFIQIAAQLQKAFSLGGNFNRFNGSELTLETGKWWLREKKPHSPQTAVHLSDRIEITLVNILIGHPGITTDALEKELCIAYPGLFTPSKMLIQTCLDSYGVVDDPAKESWRLNEADQPEKRRKELAEISKMITRIGERLGYRIRHLTPVRSTLPAPIVWEELPGSQVYTFYPIASAIIGEILLSDKIPTQGRSGHTPVIVYPQARSQWIEFKLRSDPRLRSIVERENWGFVKYRHLRRLFENPEITPNSFHDQLLLDPIERKDSQLPLL